MAADAFHALPAGEETHGVSGDSIVHLLTGRSDSCGVVVEGNRGDRILHAGFAFQFREEVKGPSLRLRRYSEDTR